jgi:hypothetical protein
VPDTAIGRLLSQHEGAKLIRRLERGLVLQFDECKIVSQIVKRLLGNVSQGSRCSFPERPTRDRIARLSIRGGTEVVIPKPRAKRPLEPEDVVQLLRSEAERMGSQSAFAKAAGVDRATVCRILRGRAPLQPKILRALNVRMVFFSVSTNEPARKHPVSRSPNRSSKG